MKRYAGYVLNAVLAVMLVIVCSRYELVSKITYRFTGGSRRGVIDPVQTERYHYQAGVFMNAPKSEGCIVMLGDSITEYTPFNEYTCFGYRIKNRGIASDTTAGVLMRINEAAGIRPVKMFVLLGINDIGNGTPQAETVSNYREIIRKVKALSPETVIYVQSVFPVDHKKLAHNDRNSRRTCEAITGLNVELERLAREEGCVFADTYSVFSVDGEMRGDCTDDGLHLNGAGMLVWVKFLEGYL